MEPRKYHSVHVGRDVFEVDVRYSNLKAVGGSVVLLVATAMPRPVTLKRNLPWCFRRVVRHCLLRG